MKTEEIVYANQYNKKVKVTIKDENSIITYTEEYKKIFHKNLINGFVWVIV